MDYEDYFAGQIAGLRQEGRYRVFADLERKAGSFPRARFHGGEEPGEVTVWCSNDYLGMGQNPRGRRQSMKDVIWIAAAPVPGAPATSREPIYSPCRCSSAELADLHGKEDALLFTSGYVSNWAALGTLAARLPDCAGDPVGRRSTTPR